MSASLEIMTQSTRFSSAIEMNNYLMVVLFIYSTLNSIVAIEISSKIDFNSDDVTNFDSSVEKSDPVVIVVGNSNTETHKEARGFLSSNSRPRTGGNVSLRVPVKSIRSHSNYPHNLEPVGPKRIKNIYIIVNGEGMAQPRNFICKEGVCQTAVSTNIDEHGNVIDTVCITIVTKSKDSKVEDVPIIDGIRGTEFDNRNPSFTFNNGRASSNPSLIDNNIPQTPSYREDHASRRNRFRPQSASFYPRNFGLHKDTPGWSPWIPSRDSVDDKIEAPLSQTKASK